MLLHLGLEIGLIQLLSNIGISKPKPDELLHVILFGVRLLDGHSLGVDGGTGRLGELLLDVDYLLFYLYLDLLFYLNLDLLLYLNLDLLLYHYLDLLLYFVGLHTEVDKLGFWFVGSNCLDGLLICLWGFEGLRLLQFGRGFAL